MIAVDANIARAIEGSAGVVLAYGLSLWRIFKSNPGDKFVQFNAETGHLTFALLIAVEVSLKVSTFLDGVFYTFCTPGLLVGFPVAMLFGVGGPHGEGVFFGILIGLPFNVFAYYWLTTQIIKRYGSKQDSASRMDSQWCTTWTAPTLVGRRFRHSFYRVRRSQQIIPTYSVRA